MADDLLKPIEFEAYPPPGVQFFKVVGGDSTVRLVLDVPGEWFGEVQKINTWNTGEHIFEVSMLPKRPGEYGTGRKRKGK